MPAHGRLFVFEFVVRPEARAATALLDFTLFVLTGGSERDEAGYRALLATADLALERTWRTAAGIDLIVARPHPPE
jgi:hypothetical protein